MGNPTPGIHMDHMGALNEFGRKFGRKNDQNLPFFFSKKKRNIKAVRRRSFMKIVNIEPIFAYICDMAPVPLPLGVGSTIEAQSQMDRRPLGICCKASVQFFLLALKFLILQKARKHYK